MGERPDYITEPEMTREEQIELLCTALWSTSDEKIAIIAAVIDL